MSAVCVCRGPIACVDGELLFVRWPYCFFSEDEELLCDESVLPLSVDQLCVSQQPIFSQARFSSANLHRGLYVCIYRTYLFPRNLIRDFDALAALAVHARRRGARGLPEAVAAVLAAVLFTGWRKRVSLVFSLFFFFFFLA